MSHFGVSGKSDGRPVIFTTDSMTVGALEALRTRAIAIPDAMAMVAIDDPFWSDLVHPPFTTLVQPIRQMAERAIGSLFQRINEPKANHDSLRFRRSSACVSLAALGHRCDRGRALAGDAGPRAGCRGRTARAGSRREETEGVRS